MIAVICLAIAAALLFWPEPAPEPLAPSNSNTSANPKKPSRRRKESPKHVAKD